MKRSGCPVEFAADCLRLALPSAFALSKIVLSHLPKVVLTATFYPTGQPDFSWLRRQASSCILSGSHFGTSLTTRKSTDQLPIAMTAFLRWASRKEFGDTASKKWLESDLTTSSDTNQILMHDATRIKLSVACLLACITASQKASTCRSQNKFRSIFLLFFRVGKLAWFWNALCLLLFVLETVLGDDVCMFHTRQLLWMNRLASKQKRELLSGPNTARLPDSKRKNTVAKRVGQ